MRKLMEEKISGRESENADRDDAFDVYGVIRSEEIREYYRKEDPLGIFEKEQLILHSYTSVEQKAALLKELSRACGRVMMRAGLLFLASLGELLTRWKKRRGN